MALRPKKVLDLFTLGRNSISQLIYVQAILVSSVMFMNLMFFKGVPGKKLNPLEQRI
jgi:hypothetical protein